MEESNSFIVIFVMDDLTSLSGKAISGFHRGWKGPFNTFSKNIFSKRVSIDQNWPNDQILCMDHYVGL